MIRPAAKTSGFTIIELMVATMVFSVVLLLVTAGIIQVARVFYKGITEANTQNTARSIIDSISQAIQFSGDDISATDPSPVAGTDYDFCLGNLQISYKLGRQVKDNPSASDQSWHAIVANINGACAGAAPQTLNQQTVLGRDMMGQNMRLSNLVVQRVGTGQPSQYRVTVRVAFGDSDLLYSPSDPVAPDGYAKSDAVCRPVRAGSQFCAISELSTIVVKRVQ